MPLILYGEPYLFEPRFVDHLYDGVNAPDACFGTGVEEAVTQLGNLQSGYHARKIAPPAGADDAMAYTVAGERKADLAYQFLPVGNGDARAWLVSKQF